MMSVFEGGVGIERGGMAERSIDIGDRVLREAGRDEEGELSADILDSCVVSVMILRDISDLSVVFRSWIECFDVDVELFGHHERH